MDDFFQNTKIGIKTLSFPNIDEMLSVSINGCLSVELRSQKVSDEEHNFIFVYKGIEYQCDEQIVKHFIKLPLNENKLTLNFAASSDLNFNNDSSFESSIINSNESNKNNNENNNNENNNNNNENINNDTQIENRSDETDDQTNSKNDNENLHDNSDEHVSLSEKTDEDSSSMLQGDIFAQKLFTNFFNGQPITINRRNVLILEFFAKEEHLNIPSFLKICSIFNKFYELYDKMDPIADIQYDLINISDIIGIDETQSEILRTDSVESLDPDFDQDDTIQQISSFGSLRSLEFPPPTFSFDFLDKIKNVIDDIVDRIANEPELTNDLILLYNILMKAATYRPENIKFYVSIIKQLNDPKPEGKGINIVDIIRELYLHKINQSTDFFILHELMVGGVFTRKEILDVVKESTNLEFKIWFAPYIEEEEAEQNNQKDHEAGSDDDNNNNNTNNNNNENEIDDDDNDYSGIIQDIEDHIYSIPEPEKRAFKAHFFASIRENNWALHKILARQGANHTPIARAIRRDDSKRLQKILAFDSNATVDDVIKWSAFDHIQFIMNSPTLIQYAAFYGSVKCFKYLMLNNATLDKLDSNKQPLINFAVAGGNAEIVRICMQQKLPTFSVISPACLFYRFDMLDWIIENVFQTINGPSAKAHALKNAFLGSLDSFNFISILKLFQFIDKNAYFKAAAVDNELILEILKLFHFNHGEQIYMLLFSTESYNFDFFKRLFNTLNIKRKVDSSNDSQDDSSLEAILIEQAAAADNNDDDDDDDNDNNHQNANQNINNANQNINNANQNINNANQNINNANQNINNANQNIDNANQNIDNNADDFDNIDFDIDGDFDEFINNLNENFNDDSDDDDDDDYGMKKDGTPIEMLDSDISTLLFQAIFNDNTELLQFIDEKIYQIDIYKKIAEEVRFDITELSVIYGAIHCLKYITQRPDFDVNMWNKDGYSILRLAILYNQSVVLKFLLSFKGLNINNTEDGGGSAFTAATWDNQIPLVKILYKHGGVDVNMRGKLGETPLTGTVLQNTPKMMELLLSFPEINVYEINKDKKTAMMLCLEKSEIECFFTLAQCDKFDINSPKSCFDCTTAVFILKSDQIPLEMIQIAINSPGINLDEIYNGDTVKSQLQKKISEMNSKINNNNDNSNKDKKH